MKFILRLLLVAGSVPVARLAAQSVTDPHITTWLTANSAQYARIWETSSDKSSGNAVSTWPRSGLTNSGGGQATSAYADIQRVAYSSTYVYVYTTGLASYTMGNWLNPQGGVFMFWPTNRAAIHRIPRTPSIPTTKSKATGVGGVWLNGVYLWENGDAQSYTTSSGAVSMGGQGIWNRLAGVAEAFNFDTANGHQPSSGAYHTHINPIGLRYQLGDNVTYNSSAKTYAEASPTQHSPILGWALDGLPIYGPYGYSSAMDTTSGVRRMTSGFQKRDGTNGSTNLTSTGRHTLPVWSASVQGKSQTLASTEYGPSVNATYPLGTFAEDYDYKGDLGLTQGIDFDLNRQNVRYCVTPEYPGGTYAYFVCIDASGTTTFPDVINQEFYGALPSGGGPSANQGTVTSITEAVTEYADAGPATAIAVTAAASGANVALSWNSAEGATYKVESSPDNTTLTTLSSAVTSSGLTTNYTATTNTNYYRVTLTAIASYDTGGTYGAPVGKTGTVLFGTAATAPSITTQPAGATVTAGTSVTFSVVATGTGPLSYQWKKGGGAISGATNTSYTIASPQTGDAGSYAVTVTNSTGSTTSNAVTLVVNPVVTAPAITTQPASATVTTGGSATFTVVASGSAPLSYQWSKNGNAISGATAASYSIAGAQAGDAGSYTCVVSNSAGSATSNAAVLTITSAAIAPAITTQPAALTVAAGGSATFMVGASGSSPFTYQWRKGGVDVGGATSASYTIANVQAGDAGSYSCVVTNSAGSATSNAATLTVGTPAVAPTITIQPGNANVTTGASATFTVVASGTAPLTYQWQKSGGAIVGATGASYTIASAQAADAGGYACVVTDNAGSVTSGTATLTVTTAAVAPGIATQPTGATIAAGGNVLLSVVANGTAPLSYQWYKDGLPIAGVTTANYAITGAQAMSAGSYTCVVTNSLGSVTSSAAVLVVSAPATAPAITTQPVSLTVAAGASATFTIVATGTAPLTYQWRKAGVAITGATAASYTIGSTLAADAGNYSCTVSNSANSVSSNVATLTVTTTAAPAITSQPASTTASAGSSVNLNVTATSGGIASYRWQRNGTDITGAIGTALTLVNLQPGDTGLYDAVVSSGAATTSAAAIVGVTTGAKVIGAGEEVQQDVFVAANGNTFDQVLVEGAAEAITSDYALQQITRTSFVDLNDDIVQVEFSGPGTLSLVLDNATGPALPVNYNQSVAYMKGHAGIVITGATAATNVSVFSVGRITAVNQALFKDNVVYDGIADLAFIAISSADGKFGGVRAADASFFATKGLTGIYAPGVQFTGPVYVGDISAFDAATGVLVLGGATGNTWVTGGDFAQANGRAVQVSGLTQLKFTNGSDSHGNPIPAKTNQAALQQNGVDVTAQIVVNPTP